MIAPAYRDYTLRWGPPRLEDVLERREIFNEIHAVCLPRVLGTVHLTWWP